MPRRHPPWRLKPGGLLAPGTVGVCGSMAAGHIRNSDSWREPSRGSRRSSALSAGSGPFTRGPYAAACQRLHGRPGRINCVRTGAEELSGGNWMVVSVLPVSRGCRCDRAPRAPLPFNYILPLRGSGLSGPLAARRAAPGTSCHEVTWLILPVVICLSQRLSHACLSISNLYCETANGSLNQLSFI